MITCNTYYYKDAEAPYNAGDIFGPFILKNLLDQSVAINYTGPSDNHHNPTIMLVGSIISRSLKGCIICGCGIMRSHNEVPNFLECYIIRGKFTLAKILKSRPEYANKIVLGDPGLVLPYLINERITIKKYKYGIILHYVDKKFGSYFADIPNVTIIDINNPDILDFANNVMQCEFIISSSLHGLIFADSLCIPTAWIRIKNTVLTSDDIKFYDYYSIYENIGVSARCNIVDTKAQFDIDKLHFNYIDNNFITNKSAEIMTCLVDVIKKHYKINEKYDNLPHHNNR